MFPLGIICVSLLYGAGSLAGVYGAKLPNNRIVGGEPAEIGEHPYQLAFQFHDKHHCGASIISTKWAVTAGHCVGSDINNYKVGAGNKHIYNATYYNVSRVVRHPQFSIIDIDYDMALLEIKGEFTYGENVQPIKLADQELRDGEIVNVTGWGKLEAGSTVSDILMRVEMPIVDREVCKNLYQGFLPVTERMICAGLIKEGGKDSCQGDSGGPLAANGTLYGIVSWGRGCARPKYPGVYTNVANLRSWITSVTGI